MLLENSNNNNNNDNNNNNMLALRDLRRPLQVPRQDSR